MLKKAFSGGLEQKRNNLGMIPPRRKLTAGTVSASRPQEKHIMPCQLQPGKKLLLRRFQGSSWRVDSISDNNEIFSDPTGNGLRVCTLCFSEQSLVPTVMDSDIVFHWHDCLLINMYLVLPQST